jgi:5-formyltetrahydrofolate cyclo-ligase
MNKQELRKDYIEKRNTLSVQECEERSIRIADLFFKEVDLSAVRVLHCFVPIVKNNEPDTWLILRRIQKEYRHINIALPRVDHGANTLTNIVFTSDEQLKKNTWGIDEPASGMKVESSLIDMILIPLLIFDASGNRVGYGKGYYDRFLSECRPDAKRVGLSLFDAIDHIDDISTHDQPLHCCITPERIVNFK